MQIPKFNITSSLFFLQVHDSFWYLYNIKIQYKVMEKIAERLIKPYNILHLRHDREKHNFSKKKQRKRRGKRGGIIEKVDYAPNNLRLHV